MLTGEELAWNMWKGTVTRSVAGFGNARVAPADKRGAGTTPERAKSMVIAGIPRSDHAIRCPTNDVNVVEVVDGYAGIFEGV